MKMERKSTTTYTYNLTDMTEREVRILLLGVRHELRETDRDLRIASRAVSSGVNSLASNETRKKRLQDKRDELEAMCKALESVLGDDEEPEDDEEDEDYEEELEP